MENKNTLTPVFLNCLNKEKHFNIVQDTISINDSKRSKSETDNDRLKVDYSRAQNRKQIAEIFLLNDKLDDEQILNFNNLFNKETHAKLSETSLAELLETQIFEFAKKNSKDKAYREKSLKVLNKIRGKTNAKTRYLLKYDFIDFSVFVFEEKIIHNKNMIGFKLENINDANFNNSKNLSCVSSVSSLNAKNIQTKINLNRVPRIPVSIIQNNYAKLKNIKKEIQQECESDIFSNEKDLLSNDFLKGLNNDSNTHSNINNDSIFNKNINYFGNYCEKFNCKDDTKAGEDINGLCFINQQTKSIFDDKIISHHDEINNKIPSLEQKSSNNSVKKAINSDIMCENPLVKLEEEQNSSSFSSNKKIVEITEDVMTRNIQKIENKDKIIDSNKVNNKNLENLIMEDNQNYFINPSIISNKKGYNYSFNSNLEIENINHKKNDKSINDSLLKNNPPIKFDDLNINDRKTKIEIFSENLNYDHQSNNLLLQNQEVALTGLSLVLKHDENDKIPIKITSEEMNKKIEFKETNHKIESREFHINNDLMINLPNIHDDVSCNYNNKIIPIQDQRDTCLPSKKNLTLTNLEILRIKNRENHFYNQNSLSNNSIRGSRNNSFSGGKHIIDDAKSNKIKLKKFSDLSKINIQLEIENKVLNTKLKLYDEIFKKIKMEKEERILNEGKNIYNFEIEKMKFDKLFKENQIMIKEALELKETLKIYKKVIDTLKTNHDNIILEFSKKVENFQDEIIKRSKESNSSYFDIKNPEKILQEKNLTEINKSESISSIMIQNSVKFEVCVKEKIKNFSYLDIENTHSLVIKNQKQKTQNESKNTDNVENSITSNLITSATETLEGLILFNSINDLNLQTSKEKEFFNSNEKYRKNSNDKIISEKNDNLFYKKTTNQNINININLSNTNNDKALTEDIISFHNRNATTVDNKNNLHHASMCQTNKLFESIDDKGDFFNCINNKNSEFHSKKTSNNKEKYLCSSNSINKISSKDFINDKKSTDKESLQNIQDENFQKNNVNFSFNKPNDTCIINHNNKFPIIPFEANPNSINLNKIMNNRIILNNFNNKNIFNNLKPINKEEINSSSYSNSANYIPHCDNLKNLNEKSNSSVKDNFSIHHLNKRNNNNTNSFKNIPYSNFSSERKPSLGEADKKTKKLNINTGDLLKQYDLAYQKNDQEEDYKIMNKFV